MAEKTVFDLTAYFIHMVIIGEQLNITKECIFMFKLFVFLSSFIDEYWCFWKRNKALLMNHLSEHLTNQPDPDLIIVDDGQQLLYHIVWSYGGNFSVLVHSVKKHFFSYPNENKKIIVWWFSPAQHSLMAVFFHIEMQ